MKKTEVERVYLVVHELFGIEKSEDYLTLVTPSVECHEYQIRRFRGGRWKPAYTMQPGSTYRLQGVAPGRDCFDLHPYSPCPGDFKRSKNKPYCTWMVPFPHRIHQLRLVSIAKQKPLFGGKHCEKVENSMLAASIVQVFEYVPAKTGKIGVVENGKPLDLCNEADTYTKTVNFHIWGELQKANQDPKKDVMHAKHAFEALRMLFDSLDLKPRTSVPSNDLYAYQSPMPDGLRFVELMSLSEIYNLENPSGDLGVEDLSTPRTCGIAGNLYVKV